ncbi:MAG: hypothetical protein ACIALR_12685, partial [Blastopirellula sp. JB062]
MFELRNLSLTASAVTVFLSLAACLSAQDDAQPPTAEAAKPEAALAERQERLAKGFSRLEDLMIKMAEIDEIENPERAKLLREAAHSSKDKLIRSQLLALAAILKDGKLKRAVDGQKDVSKDLANLLQLLQSENRDDELKTEQERIREYIKETRKLLNRQRSLQGRSEGGEETERLSDGQDQLSQDAAKLAQRMQENEETQPQGESSDQEPNSNDNQPSDSNNSRPKDAKPGDEPKEGEPNSGDDSKPESKENQPGEMPADPQSGEPGKPNSDDSKQPSEETSSGKEQKPGESSESESKPGQPQQG